MRYLLRFYGKHKILYTILIILLVISGTLFGSVWDIGDDVYAIAVEENRKSLSKECQMFMAETMSDITYYSYIEDGDTRFDCLQMFREEMEKDTSFHYIVQSDQALDVRSPKTEDIFLAEYEQGTAENSVFELEGEMLYSTKALQVSKGFFEHYGIQAESGELFQAKDYRYKPNETVPVVLGAAYKEVFQLGDVIQADYLMNRMEFRVIGFLKNDAFYQGWNSNELISCERYIIMPAFFDLPGDEFGKRALLQYFTAYIVSDDKYDRIYENIQGIMKKTGVSEDDINVVDLNREEEQVDIFKTYSAMTDAVSGYFKIIIGLMIGCIGVVLTIVLTNMIQEENYNFGVYIMCGMKRRKLAALIFLFDGAIVGAGDFLVTLLLWANEFSVKSILVVQAVLAFVLFASFGVCYLRLRMLNIVELIGGKE